MMIYNIYPRTNGRFYFSCPVPSCKRTFKEVGRKLAVHINKIHPDKEIGTTKLSAPELRYLRGPALGFKHFSVLSICYLRNNVNSILFNLIQFNSIQFNLIQFNSIQEAREFPSTL